MAQTPDPVLFNDNTAVAEALKKRVDGVPIQTIIADLKPFLEDAEENKALEHYPILFNQLILNLV